MEGRGGKEDWVERMRTKRGNRGGVVEQTRGRGEFVAVFCYSSIFLCWNQFVFLFCGLHVCGSLSSVLHAADCVTGLEPVERREGRGGRGDV